MRTKITRLLLSAVLMMCCTVMANAQAQAPAGDGSKGNPYQITNFYQLYWFSLQVYQENIYACAILMNDIERDNTVWVPIGYDDYHVYCGEFNGNGHVIKGLHNNRDEYDAYSGSAHKNNCLGLFGKIDKDGSVHDVGVENCDFYGLDRVGAICGDLARGEVYNCWSSGYICVNSAAGGLVGSCWFNSKLRNCYTSCNVVVSEWTDQYVGGVCGSVAGKVENCFMLEKTDGWAEKPIGAPYGDTYVISNVAAKPNGAFSSGEVCWLLNGGVTNRSQGWYQTLGTDNMPTLSKSSKTVSRCRAKCTSDNYFYNNDKVEMDAIHALAYRPKYSCVTTGYDTEYWECLGCHKLYSDRECTHEINQSDLGEAKSGIDVTKDSEWLYTDNINPIGSNLWFNSCYYIDTPAPYSGQKTTSISFKVNVDDYDFSFVWYFNQWGYIDGGNFVPDARIIMTFTLNGEEKYSEKFTYDTNTGGFVDDHKLRSISDGTWFSFGRLKKGDVVKIEIDLRRYSNSNNRKNQIIFSIHPTHQFKHVNATSLYREHWECEHCHNLFASNAHPDSDEDICSQNDLVYEEPKKNDGYYEIRNEGTLYWLAREVNENGNTAIKARLTADIRVNNNVLDQNGNLNDASSFLRWTPIGGQGYSYSGEFDGNGHTISGLYFSDANRQAVGLFGKAAGSTDNPADRAYIHDVGVRDSYFNGKSHVGGICGDFALGRMENCWNAATVQSVNSVAGGIAGSCWRYASMSGCYNIGKVSEGTESGGVCGIVSKNNEVDYSVSNCVSLEGKCSVAYNLYPATSPTYADDGGAKVNNVFNDKDASAFASGDVCWILNGEKIDTKWRQQIGKDAYPVWTGNYLVNYYDDSSCYCYNETMCEKENGIHNFEKKEVKRCDNTTFNHWYCLECEKRYSYEGDGGHKNQTRELSEKEFSVHNLEFVKAAVLPTYTTTGHYDYWHCTRCNKDFLEGDFSNPVTSEQLTVQKMKNNEIWYTSTIQVYPYNNNFKEKIISNQYKSGLGVITFDKDLTYIGDEAFLGYIPSPYALTTCCYYIESIIFPSSVTEIGRKAFSECKNLRSVTFNSLPVLGTYAFYPCANLNNRILDLTDSDKPFIGNRMNDYHPFTEAHYHRTLANDGTTWGTITLPFVPASTEGLKFYTLKDAASDKVVLTEVTNIEAGVPYLFKNCGENAEFTLTATDPTVVVNPVEQEAINGMKLVGAFRKDEFTGDGTKYGLYGGNTFMTTTGTLTINPFRAYLETAVSGAKAIVIDNEADGIDDIRHLSSAQSQEGVNVQGMRVGNSYKGIVIKNGKKYLNK